MMATSKALEEAHLAYDVALADERACLSLHKMYPNDEKAFARWQEKAAKTSRCADALARACDAEAAADYAGQLGV